MNDNLQKIPNFALSYHPGRGLKRRLCMYYEVATQPPLIVLIKVVISLTPHVLSNFGMKQAPAPLLTGQLALDSIRTNLIMRVKIKKNMSLHCICEQSIKVAYTCTFRVESATLSYKLPAHFGLFIAQKMPVCSYNRFTPH